MTCSGVGKRSEICGMLSNALRLLLCLPLALLAGCEGSTTMTHTLYNRSEDSLVLKTLFDSLSWYDTATVMLPPGQMHTLYTYDMRGKCHECFGLYSPTLWIDTIEVQGKVWAIDPSAEDQHWTSEITEGRSWIRFDHTLSLTDQDFE